MKREIIAPNVYLTQLPNEKFKQNRLTVSMIVPNDKDKATMYAILPGLMERAYEDYPTMREFSRKLNKMYAASLSVSSTVIGANRCIRFTIQGIKNEYCIEEGEDLLSELCDVLIGVILKPCLEEGSFVREWLEVEKFKLREEIEGQVNDKRSYCIKNARKLFFKDSPNGVDRLGYLDEIDTITSENLYACYKQLLDRARIEIFITANNRDTAVAKMKTAFSYERKADAEILPIIVEPCLSRPEEFTEHMDTVQGKICLLYTTQRQLTEEERYHMLVAGALFGGTASSRLFKNVREKQSLCYYCAAGFNGFTSCMSVDSGVEHQNAQKTVRAIQYELKNTIENEIPQREIDETKLTIKTSLQSNYDGLYGLEAWYLNEAIRGTLLTPEYVMEQVEKVTADDIRNVLKLLNLNVIYAISK